MESISKKEAQGLFDLEKIKQKLNWEIILFGLIILAAITTRFYNLGTRVMSHDESINAFYAWRFFKGQGYSHSPILHGPLQFHLIAFTYFLFGDSDFSSRIPAAISSVASVIFIWKFRRYLGKSGTLITAGLFVISPFMLYYGRYVRNEALVVLFGLVNLWATLRYLETGKSKYAYYLAVATAFHFIAKETSFIYLAQTLIFLGLVFLREISNTTWKKPELKRLFFIFLLIVFSVAAIMVGANFFQRSTLPLNQDQISQPIQPNETSYLDIIFQNNVLVQIPFLFGGLAIAIITILFVGFGYGTKKLKSSRPLHLLVLFGLLALPHLAVFPIRFLHQDTPDLIAQEPLGLFAPVVISLFLASMLIGMWWNVKDWLIVNGIFYGIYILFYTTLFTNGNGIFSGLVGSLAFWFERQRMAQEVQPLYYYFLIQIPIYEYLAALGTILAAIWGIRMAGNRNAHKNIEPDVSERNFVDPSAENLAIYLFGFWTISASFVYTLARGKMPWFTTHITLPMLLLAGWGIGKIIESINWNSIRESRSWAVIPFSITLIISLAVILLNISGPVKPFSGQTLEQLQVTSNFLTAGLAFSFSLFVCFKLIAEWPKDQVRLIFSLSFFVILIFMTGRTAFNATYKNHDNAAEYLAYSQGAMGVKEVMSRIEALSRKTAGELSIKVAIDNEVAWPFSWYLRNYPNQVVIEEVAVIDPQSFPVVVIGDDNEEMINRIVEQEYENFAYTRLAWPDQSYFNLNSEKLIEVLSKPSLRKALFDIWWERDLTTYGEYKSMDFSLNSWELSDTMRLYIRKDLINEMWEYGGGVPIDELIVDPYEGKQITRLSDFALGFEENGASLLNGPRDLAVAPDGSIFVADSRNNRVVRFLNGEIIQIYETDQDQTQLFNEPWGVALSHDGEYLYVADTWNHQIVKLALDGEVITSWGIFDQTDDPYAFWGPRDIVVDKHGNLLVTNTGNKRIAAFTPEGEFLYQFGGVGYELGKFDEPVGMAIDPVTGNLYVTDTWNQRIQVFEPLGNGVYSPSFSWDIIGWYGRTLENKPYLNFGPDGNLYVSDPDQNRILVFRPSGEFLHYFEVLGTEGGIGQPISLVSDNEHGIWVSDNLNNRLVHFPLP